MSRLTQTVPDGYLKTELGVIPSDWKIYSIIEIVRNIIDYRGRTPKKLGLDWGGGDIVALSAGNVKKGFIDFEEDCYLGSVGLYKKWMKNGHVEKGDIVFTMEAPLGNVALIPDSNRYILSQRTILLQLDKDLFDSRLVFQVLMSSEFQKLLGDSATGSTAQGIKRTRFEQLKLYLPSEVEEQTAIANALSDVDALLTELEKLVTKKQAIKTATMQQLLTGKTRLPQFATYTEGKKQGQPKGTKPSELGEIPEDWYFINIGNNAVLKARIGWQALTTKEYLDTGSKYLVTGTDFDAGEVNWNSCCFVSDWRYKQDTNIQLKENDVLITKDGTIGKVGFINELPLPATLNSGVFVVRPKAKSFYPKYLFYVLTSSIFKSFIKGITAGSTITHLYQKDFVHFEFPAPDVEEQTAIATILTDMDNEIQTLEQRLAKTRQIKQGMMQELLTGRTRLPFDQE